MRANQREINLDATVVKVTVLKSTANVTPKESNAHNTATASAARTQKSTTNLLRTITKV